MQKYTNTMLYQVNAICWRKKNVLNLKTQIKKLTLGFLYEMVFVWNDSSACVCKFRYHFVQKILVRSYSYASVRNGLLYTMWSLFEKVFVWSDLTPLWFIQLLRKLFKFVSFKFPQVSFLHLLSCLQSRLRCHYVTPLDFTHAPPCNIYSIGIDVIYF